MEFVVDRKVLEEAVSQASVALVKNPMLSAYGLLSFHTYENGTIVSTHGQDMSIQSFMEGVSVPGLAFAVDGLLFSDIVKKLTGKDVTFSIHPENLTLKVSCEGIKVNLNIADSNSFLSPHNYQNMPFIKTKGLLECLKAVSYAVSDDDNRVNLMGILINEEEVVAVDGHRMSVRSHLNDLVAIVNSAKEDTVLPAESVIKLTKVFKDEDMSLFSDDASVYFSNGKVAASVRKTAKSFPNYKAIIPIDGHDVLQIQRRPLIEALEFVKIGTDKFRTVNLDVRDGSVRIWSKMEKISCIEENLEAVFNNSVDLCFNLDYLLDVAKRLKNDTISVEIRGSSRPIVIREENSLHVVMPKKR